MEFVVIDVETANADRGSICQVGLALYSGDTLAAEWSSLVNPEAHFSAVNVSIHGIGRDAVSNAPTLVGIAESLYRFMDGRIVVAHSGFDRSAVTVACAKYGLRSPDCTWLDSVRIARRAWPHLPGGHGLKNVTQALGYTFNHHDALADAKAAGHIVRSAIAKTGIDIVGWLARVEQPVDGIAGRDSTGRDRRSDR